MYNLIKGEFLKLKRSSILKIAILSSLITPLFLLMILVRLDMSMYSSWTFVDLFTESVSYITVLFGLLINIIIVSHLYNKEFIEHTLKSMMSIGISKNKYLLIKFITFILLSTLLIILTWFLVLIIGLGYGVPGLTMKLLIDSLIQHIGANFLLMILITPIIFLTLVFKNIIPSLIIGIATVMGSFMIMGDKWAALYPGTSIYLIVTKQIGLTQFYNYNPFISLAIIVLISIIGIILTLIYFNKTDVYL